MNKESNTKADNFLSELKPSISIAEIYGDNLIYNPRPSLDEHGHFAENPVINEIITGREISIMGNTPIICCEAVATAPAVDCLEKAGLLIPPVRYTYRSEEEYLKLLKHFTEQNQKLIIQHPHPEHQVPASLYWIDPAIPRFLNDKKNVDKLVPEEYCLARSTLSYEKMAEQISDNSLTSPVVLKTGDGEPTAGGFGVKICKTSQDIEDALEFFSEVDEVIAEQYVNYNSNICIQFAAAADGEITYLGNSEQIVTKDGNHKGSWLNVDHEKLPAAVSVGKKIMKDAQEKGYVGVAGFDVIFDEENFYFIDLNFRLNASTGGLLLFESITRQYGIDNPEVRLYSFSFEKKFDELISLLEYSVEKRLFTPLSIFNLEHSDYKNRDYRVTGLIIGTSRDEVSAKIIRLQNEGITT